MKSLIEWCFVVLKDLLFFGRRATFQDERKTLLCSISLKGEAYSLKGLLSERMVLCCPSRWVLFGRKELIMSLDS